MTRDERRLLNRIKRRASRMAPELARLELAVYARLRDLLTDAELAVAIRNGTIDATLAQVMAGERGPLFDRLRAHLHQELVGAVGLAASDVGVGFALSPVVLEAADKLNTRVIQGLADEIRETVRQHVRAGLSAGQHPRTVARGLRDVIGLAPNQEEAVRNFRRLLEAGDREALTRALRDRRFDRTLNRALGRAGTGLTAEQIGRMTTAYRKRMVAFNAETHARTAAMDTHRLAQRTAWDQAVGRGIVAQDQLVRRWVTVGDSRVRPEHVAMNGEETTWNAPYSNGELVPGESTYNCRCIERVYEGTIGDGLRGTPHPASVPEVPTPTTRGVPEFATTQEAEAWARIHLADDVNLSGLPPDVARSFIKEFSDIQQQHGLGRLSGIESVTSLDSSVAAFVMEGQSSTLQINAKFISRLSDEGISLADWMRSQGRNGLFAGDTIADLAHHEAQHWFHRRGMGYELRQAVSAAYKAVPPSSIRDHISRYATKNEFEFFAELSVTRRRLLSSMSLDDMVMELTSVGGRMGDIDSRKAMTNLLRLLGEAP